jgi:hypothetical protein
MTMYVFCVYPAVSQSQSKTTASWLKRTDPNVFQMVFNCAPREVHLYTVTVFAVALHEPGTRKAISWSVTIIQSMQFDCSNRTSAG